MKHSFFIDSTDGILKVFTTPLPEEPAVKASIYADTMAMSKYEQAISLAKKAAVEVDLEHGPTLHAILGPTIHNVNEYLNRELVPDRIYELLVGEIEIDNRWMQPCVVAKRCLEGKSSPEDRDDWCKNSDGCKLSHFKHFARIKPKVEPLDKRMTSSKSLVQKVDHECEMILMTDVSVYSCDCGKIEVANNLSNRDEPLTYIPEPKKVEESELTRDELNALSSIGVTAKNWYAVSYHKNSYPYAIFESKEYAEAYRDKFSATSIVEPWPMVIKDLRKNTSK